MENNEVVKVYPTTPDAEGYFFENEKNEADGVKSRIYPSPADEDGWFTETADDEDGGIQTKVYENNGGKVKRGKLSDGREFLVRELKGRDTIQMSKQTKNDEALMVASMMSMAIKVAGVSYVMEDMLDKFKLKDYTKMSVVCQELNF